MVPAKQIVLTGISVTIAVPGEGGSAGAVWRCGSNAANMLSVTSTAHAAAGTVFSNTGSQTIAAGVKVIGWMESSDEDITPTANVVCEYN